METSGGARRTAGGDGAMTEVFTDGACKGNPGPGGWAWVEPGGRSGQGGEPQTTNQRMELRAVLEAVRAIDGPIRISSDSTYVVNCFNDRWYEGWRKRNWKNSQKKPVANRDLWEPLVDLYLERADEIEFRWVKGHAGNEWNERADALAVAEAERFAAPPTGDDALAGRAVPWTVDRALWVVGTTTPDADLLAALDGTLDGLDPEHDLLVSGLRRGIELEAAERAQQRRIPVAVVLPFADPAERWVRRDRERFDRVRARAVHDVVLAGDRSRPGTAVGRRNEWIAGAVVGVIVADAPEVVDLAEERDLSVIDLALLAAASND